jgi:hypothetical protein
MKQDRAHALCTSTLQGSDLDAAGPTHGGLLQATLHTSRGAKTLGADFHQPKQKARHVPRFVSRREMSLRLRHDA